MKNILFVLLSSVFCIGAQAKFPDKPVKIIITLPAGSGPDVQLRKAAEVLSEKWQQTVIVENHPGGSGMVGIQQLLKESTDGHVLGMLNQGDSVAFPILYPDSTALSKLEPLQPFFTADMALFTSPEIKNLAELSDLLKQNPLYGSWAVGSIGHLASAQFAGTIVPNAKHVGYKQYGPWYIDTNNKVLSFGFTSLGSGRSMQESGKIHYLAIASNKRHPKFPGVPTVKEATGQNLVAQSWLAFYGNRQIPTAIKKQLMADLRSALLDPRVDKMLTDNYFIPLANMPLTEFKKQIEQERVDYAQNLKKYNITIK